MTPEMSKNVVREAEHARIASALYSASGGYATVCVIEGAVGSGKSTLLNDAAADIRSRGVSVIELAPHEPTLPTLDRSTPRCIVIEDAHLADDRLLAEVDTLLDAMTAPNGNMFPVMLLVSTAFSSHPTIRRLWAAADLRDFRITLRGMTAGELQGTLQINGFNSSGDSLAAIHASSGGYPGLALAQLRSPHSPPEAVAEAMILPELNHLCPLLRAHLEVLSLTTAAQPAAVIAKVAALVSGPDPEAVAGAAETDYVAIFGPVLNEDRESLLLTDPLWRRVAAEHAPPARARQIHRLMLEHTSGLAHATHQSALVDEDGDPVLAADLEARANRALLHGDYDQAARYMAVAVRVSRGQERKRRFIEAGLMVAVVGRPGDTVEVFSGLAMLGDEPMATVLEAGVAFFADQFATARSLIHRLVQQETLESLRDDTDLTSYWRALVLLSVVEVASGHEDGAYRAARKAWDLNFTPSTTIDGVLEQTLALQESSSLWGLGRITETVAMLDALIPRLAGTADHADGLYHRGRVHFYAGRSRAALQDMERAEQESHQAVVPAAAQRGMAEHAMIEFHLGRWHGASLRAEQVLAMGRETGDLWGLTTAHAVLAMVAAARMDHTGADEHLDWLTHEVGTSSQLPLFNAMAARVWSARLADDPDRVLELIAAFRRTDLAAWADRVAMHSWRAFEVEALITAGRPQRAELLLVEFAERVSKHPGLPLPYGHPEALRAKLADTRGALREAEQHYTDAITLGAEFVYARAQDLRNLGEIQRSLGKHVQADESLRRSREIFLRLGAEPDLMAMGTRQPPVAGRFADLTKREQDVAYLVAQGMTNKEVAESLFVTVKTVEYHVSRILPKLGMQSRKEMWNVADMLARRVSSPMTRGPAGPPW